MSDSNPTPAVGSLVKHQGLRKLLFIGKIFFIGFLILIFNLPMGMIQSLINERNERRESTDLDVTKNWGSQQMLSGPMLIIPYLTYSEVIDTEIKSGGKIVNETHYMKITPDGIETNAKTEKKKRIISETHYLHILPDDMEITGTVSPEVRYRGIYKVLLYKAALALHGKFTRPDMKLWRIPEKDVLWDEAVLIVGVPDMRAIQEQNNILLNNSSLPFMPSTGDRLGLGNGIEAKISSLKDIPVGQEIDFKFNLDLAGSEKLSFIPMGKETRVGLNSPWQHPSFSGAYLPQSHHVNEKGFEAQWKVLYLGRPYPQTWTDAEIDSDLLKESAFGVDMIFPIDTYQKTTRSAKYGILFILLTFVTFFFVELFNKIRIHPVQYLLVGFALCLFYLSLLSLSEHISFALSYLIATATTALTIGLYSFWVLKNAARAFMMMTILAALYGYLYILLQLEDFALLLGAGGLFLVLALMMFITRKVDWYSLSGSNQRTAN